MAALYDIIKVHQSGANILVVSHGHTLRLLLSLLGGATWENHRDEGKSVSLLHTSISIVKYDSESVFILSSLTMWLIYNDHTHSSIIKKWAFYPPFLPLAEYFFQVCLVVC